MSGFRQKLSNWLIIAVLLAVLFIGLASWGDQVGAKHGGSGGGPDPNAGECMSTWC